MNNGISGEIRLKNLEPGTWKKNLGHPLKTWNSAVYFNLIAKYPLSIQLQAPLFLLLQTHRFNPYPSYFFAYNFLPLRTDEKL